MYLKDLFVVIMPTISTLAYAEILIDPAVSRESVSVVATTDGGVTYSTVSIGSGSNELVSFEPGSPSLPAMYRKYILPPGQQIQSITVSDEIWRPRVAMYRTPA